MISTIRYTRVVALLFGVTSLALSAIARADPPTRVARLGYITGAVSYSPAGETQWVEAPLNRPLVTGDRLWADAGARDELQVGNAAIRMSSNTSVTLLNLDDRVAQLQLSQGTLNVRVRRLGPNDIFEIDTPNLAFSLREPGSYRVDVDPDGNATTVVVRSGQGEADGEGAAYTVDAAQSARFAGTGLRDYQFQALSPADEFDRWVAERDHRLDSSASARYVSPDMIGYEDLDDQGSWRGDGTYGNVWVPRVAADWSPYHDGHWAWVDPWGWTWVDDAPWGFAVSHYGRWVNMSGSWGWVPGPIAAQPVYAPALVAFVGGGGFQLSVSGGNVNGVAWFPLGPQDVYRPPYQVSLNYFAGINTGSTTVNRTNITNIYNNTNVTNITYVNRTVPGAVVAVSATAFAQSQPVSKAAVRLTKDQISKAPIAPVAAVAPVAASVRGAAAPGHTPPAAVLTRQVVVKTAPPAAPIPFASKQAAMAANPGRPLNTAALAHIAPAPAAQAPQVKIVHPAQAAIPVSKAPPSVPTSRTAPAAAAPINRQQSAVAPVAPGQAMRPPEKSVPARSAEAPPAEMKAPARVASPEPAARPPAKAVEPESAQHQAFKPPAAPFAPQEHSMPAREAAHQVVPQAPEAHAPIVREAKEPPPPEVHAPVAHQVKEPPAPEVHEQPAHLPAPPPAHPPVAPAHPPAAPPPKPEAAKHVDPHPEKAEPKKPGDDKDKEHKE
jgi:hypothetical protein